MRNAELVKIIDWIPKVWQHLNKFLEAHSSSDVTIGKCSAHMPRHMKIYVFYFLVFQVHLCTFPCAISGRKGFFNPLLLAGTVFSGKLYKKFLNFFFPRKKDLFRSPGYKWCQKIWLIVFTLKATVFHVDSEDFELSGRAVHQIATYVLSSLAAFSRELVVVV